MKERKFYSTIKRPDKLQFLEPGCKVNSVDSAAYINPSHKIAAHIKSGIPMRDKLTGQFDFPDGQVDEKFFPVYRKRRADRISVENRAKVLNEVINEAMDRQEKKKDDDAKKEENKDDKNADKANKTDDNKSD